MKAVTDGCWSLLETAFRPGEPLHERQRKTLVLPLLFILVLIFCTVISVDLARRGLDIAPRAAAGVAVVLVCGSAAAFIIITKTFSQRLLEVLLITIGCLVCCVFDVLNVGEIGEWVLIIPLTDGMLLTHCRSWALHLMYAMTLAYLLAKMVEEIWRPGLYDLWNNPEIQTPQEVSVVTGVMRLVVRLLLLACDATLTGLFVSGMHRERARLRDFLVITREITESLVEFDLSRSEKLLSKIPPGQEETRSVFSELVFNLRMYEPFIPRAVISAAHTGIGSDTRTKRGSAPSTGIADSDQQSGGTGRGSDKRDVRFSNPMGRRGDSRTSSSRVQQLLINTSVSSRDVESRGALTELSVRSALMSPLVTDVDIDWQRSPLFETTAAQQERRLQRIAQVDAALGTVNVLSARRVSLLRCTSGGLQGGMLPSGSEVLDGLCCNVLDTAQRCHGIVMLVYGDFVDVSWNSHSNCSMHARHAVVCAKDTADAESLPQAWTVNVSTGTGHCGNVGNAGQRYPVVAGPVHLSAKCIARFTCQVDIRCAMDERSYEHVRGLVSARSVDCLRLEVDPVTSEDVFVYEVLDKPMEASASQRWTQAFGALRTLSCEKAAALFRDHADKFPEDVQARRMHSVACMLLRRSDQEQLLGSMRTYCRAYVGWMGLEQFAERRGGSELLPRELALSPREPALHQSSHQLPLTPVLGPDQTARSLIASPEQPTDDASAAAALSEDCASCRLYDMLLRSEREETLLRRQIETQRKAPTTVIESGRRVDGELPMDIMDSRGMLWHRTRSPIASGTSGKVWLALGGDGSLVALKSMRLPPSLLPNDGAPATPESPLEGGIFPFVRNVVEENAGTLGAAGDVVDELLREVSLMSSLRHDNVVYYLGSVCVAQHLVIVMEYLPGGSLSHLLHQFNQQLPMTTVQRYTREMLRGLCFLHQTGVIHRDFKPHNVLLATDGQCKLADFGAAATLAAATHAALTAESLDTAIMTDCSAGPVGTPHYMAPEACRGQSTYASDIWGLGITVAELITGRLPYDIPAVGHGIFFIQKLARLRPPPRHSRRESAHAARVVASLSISSSTTGSPARRKASDKSDEQSHGLSSSVREEPPPRPSMQGLTGAAFRFVSSCCEVTPGARPSAAALLSDPFLLS